LENFDLCFYILGLSRFGGHNDQMLPPKTTEEKEAELPLATLVSLNGWGDCPNCLGKIGLLLQNENKMSSIWNLGIHFVYLFKLSCLKVLVNEKLSYMQLKFCGNEGLGYPSR
jgi:hypothetical protein